MMMRRMGSRGGKHGDRWRTAVCGENAARGENAGSDGLLLLNDMAMAAMGKGVNGSGARCRPGISSGSRGIGETMQRG